MSQRESILHLLQSNSAMTQGELAEAMYGDRNHMPNIYSALMGLVDQKVVIRSGSHPSYYSLSSQKLPVTQKVPKPQTKSYRDVSGDVISNETLEEASRTVRDTGNYGPENDLIARCLQRFPDNTDPDIVALKIGLIDITNSTHLSQYKSRISMVELCQIIAAIPDIDKRIQSGDPSVVSEIARSNGNINLFSFASKYCCYHNCYLYGNDDYSIFDGVLRDYLPLYFDDITIGQIKKWQNSYDYQSYNDYITRKLNELGITVPFRKRKFDHFVWYKNR